jgi:hypothetical protein
MKPDWLTAIQKSKVAHLNQHLVQASDAKPKKRMPRRSSKEVSELHWQLHAWCIEKDLLLVSEHTFHTARKYRFDWAIFKGVTIEQVKKWEYGKENMIAAVEYQGGIFMETKSGHSSAAGATRDSDKLNLAQSLGWPVLTFTALNYRGVIQELEIFNE